MTIHQIIHQATLSLGQALCELKIALDKSGCQHTDLIIDEASHSFKRIQEISAQNITTEALEQQIRYFLKLRADYIAKFDADYLALPYSPINRVCIQLAQLFAKSDEPIIRILLPNLTIDDYHILGESLIELTEKDRELDLSTFILSEDKRAIIPLIQWFESKIRSADKPFTHQLFTENNQEVVLHKKDLERLRFSIMPESLDFFEIWQWKEEAKMKEGTLSAFMIHFCGSIRGFGQGHIQATLGQAAPGAYDAIRDFFTVWNALPENTINTLRDLSCAEHNLGYYLDYLESRVNPDKFKDSHFDISTEICIQDTSKYIKETIDRNSEKFTEINIDQTNVSTEKSCAFYPQLNSLKDKMEQRIANRCVHIQNACNDGGIKSKEEAYRPYSQCSDYLSCFYEYFSKLNVNEIHIRSEAELNAALQFFNSDIISRSIKNISKATLEKFLLDAIKNNHGDAAKLLMSNDPELAEKIMFTYHAGINNQKKCLFLLKHGASFDFKINKTPFLTYAVQGGWDDVLSFLQDKQVNIDEIDDQGETALHHACKNGASHRIKLLLNFKPKIDIKNHQRQKTAFEVYLMSNFDWNDDLVVWFLKAGSSPGINYTDLRFFRLSVKKCVPKSILALLDKEIDISDTDEYGNTALHDSCMFWGYQDSLKDDMIQLLLSRMQQYINTKNKRGFTPLDLFLDNTHHISVNDTTLALFIKQGASFNEINVNRRSLFLHATLLGCHKTVAALIEKNVDINQRSLHGETALHLACEKNHVAVVRLLLNKNAQVNVKNCFNKTALQCYIENRRDSWNFDALKLLLDHGARINPEPSQNVVSGETRPLFANAVAPLPAANQLPACSELVSITSSIVRISQELI